ncbi:MAG: HigA family addiction module antidote protein [Nitrospirales bacterium]|nr:HigA family addiction module antidote protein [Nitrospirales bacterium]
MKHLKNIHPGEVLLEEFPAPMGISAYWIAKETGLSSTRLGQIIKENRGITAETAIKIGRYLSTGPEFWMNLQSLYDIEEAERQYGKEVKAIPPYSQPKRRVPENMIKPRCYGSYGAGAPHWQGGPLR